MTNLRDTAMTSKAWPFEEARRLVKRYEKAPPEKGYVLFETGYGPSGLPHIGTFGEVARTTMVRRAFEVISDIPTRLICFSDDMDGLRKIPTNVPNQEQMAEDLHLPLTKVRDPFGTHDSFGAHNNARLNAFLDSYGFEYEFISSTDYYRDGHFDEMLLTALERFDRILDIMLPTLGEERRATYSPFLPVSPKTGHVLQVPTLERNVAKGTIVYEEPDGERVEVPVTGGHVKMQWKPDWAMRWAALGVDYEMSGKDLIDSVTQATKICRALGRPAPETLTYELFNDEQGQKISKSKGNGLSMEEWLTYAAPESLQYFMYQKPKSAKRLYFDVIPKAVDEYHQQLRAYGTQDAAQRMNNPVFHIHGHNVPASNMVVSFAMLLNLASVASAEDKEALWGFIRRYAPDATPESHPDLDQSAGFAVRYYNDFVKPHKVFREADEKEAAAMRNLADRLRAYDGPVEDEALQTIVFAVGKEHAFEPLRDWFKALYEVLLGASQGPRFGGFVALYGVAETVQLIEDGLAGKLAA
ncbi:lysine--tRNA ligase [Roseobacter sp. HKCCD9010]|uniref:lysine--tRNA ligase n=1 Tax=unclassified Roseobacter TaxID=196798 RepID=UPI001490C5AF|nr:MULTISPECIES: lysine--tRNA ligase [unclassified Roseobacter]MBF9051562.1 lysine--tRNA ligase [Rhodobacterales bacterium HKCCD4356]NNV13086.1 lysine--tRNA ligase [Roseobacter sp. HKCCD7357]NNV17337.1 lysine--tRNA ligase [Roseobacter sp. HKCCD8768]NNV26943.1 lysine--tRNA ligase [Roseobacter sp. HKCCD8192]NNV31063.1 lysine--tRNA ligase [Roseobacter sp. HKCCD9061]